MGETSLPDSGVTPPPFIDPTGDEFVTPLDALTIINFLNTNGGIGEGELSQTTSEQLVMPVTPMQIIETVGPQVMQEIQQTLDESRAAALGDADVENFIGPLLPASHLAAPASVFTAAIARLDAIMAPN